MVTMGDRALLKLGGKIFGFTHALKKNDDTKNNRRLLPTKWITSHQPITLLSSTIINNIDNNSVREAD